ncbi:MAG: cell division protein ZapA [Bacteroidales bacterium]|nr:cell division protein ZapA [Bacteroidales bacterium]
MEKQKITLMIGQRRLPFNVDADSEPLYRAAAKRINDRVAAYKSRFSERDMEDILGIVLLEMAVTLQSQEEKNDSKAVAEQLQRIEQRLESYIHGR